MATLNQIDLANLPAPAVVEVIAFEDIFLAMLADLQARDPVFTALVESDPAYKVLEVAAYREVILRQRINDAAKNNMLAYATGTDLDNLAALLAVQRLTLVPADPGTLPPTVAVMESDIDLRFRAQLAFEGISTAGPKGSYAFHALTVSTIKDVAVAGPPTVAAGNVRVTVLSRNATQTSGATSGELAAVSAILNSEDIRPLTDAVTVQAASMVAYKLHVHLYVLAGWDAAVAQAAATANINAYAESVQKVGYDVRVSGIFRAAHVAGVEHVTLESTASAITADLAISIVQASFLTNLTVATFAATP